MKVLNIGSLNIDRVYSVNQFVTAQETLMVNNLEIFCGGKGLNQSIALARAGAEVYHAGAVGDDGEGLCRLLEENKVNLDYLQRLNGHSGHAVIQLTPAGQNCILVHGGTNQALTHAHIDAALAGFAAGDILLLQNEVCNVAYAMKQAHEKGLKVALNPSPITQELLSYPLHLVDYFILNEVEGRALSGKASDDYEEILLALAARFPEAHIVLTVGHQGVLYHHKGITLRHIAYKVSVVDTTAAGDTFCGYFLACITQGCEPAEALEWASLASSLTVSSMGAGGSIPTRSTVEAFRSHCCASAQ